MKKDILEKGAIVQRDRETYAIAPPIPGGITNSAQLRLIADVADKYDVKALKLTSAQRVALVGLGEEDIDAAWADLGVEPAGVIGPCVRSIKICPGTTFCKKGKQDAVGVGLKLDENHHGQELPYKFKMGVSGCMNDCSEVCIKDVGLVATPKGWKAMVGGSGGAKPHISMELAAELDDDAAVELVGKIITWLCERAQKARLWKIIDEIGLHTLKAELGI